MTTQTEANETEKLLGLIRREIELEQATLPEEYYYQSLPLCVIDAVFSIGVKYESVRNTVSKYCDHFGLKRQRTTEKHPAAHEQESIDSFVQKYEEIGVEAFAATIYQNRQRTSTRNGILKAEAVYRFSKGLLEHGVHVLQDVDKVIGDAAFEARIKAIPGQKSGISLVYFYMLAGEDEKIKPDRMIIRFLEKALQRQVKLEEAQHLLEASASILSAEYKHITPRLLDYQIWNYTRAHL